MTNNTPEEKVDTETKKEGYSSFPNIKITDVATFFTILLSTHYYLSYRWISSVLTDLNIDFFSVLTIDDLTYTFINLNTGVLFLSASGFIWILWWHVSNSFSEEEPDVVNNIQNGFKNFKKWFLGVSLQRKVLTILVSVLIIGITLYLSPRSSDIFPIHIELFFYLIFLLVPTLYILFPQARKMLLLFQFLLMFLWANLFVSHIIKTSKTSDENSLYTEVQFSYKEEYIKTSDSLKFIYHGYKYVILYSTSDSTTLLYPTQDVGQMKIRKVDVK